MTPDLANRLCYIATPYTKWPDLDRAYAAARNLADELRSRGFIIRAYEPIVVSHPLACATGLDPRDWQFWTRLNEPWLARCDVLLVGTLPGWRESVGVGVEIAAFKTAGKPIYYVDPATLEIREAA